MLIKMGMDILFEFRTGKIDQETKEQCFFLKNSAGELKHSQQEKLKLSLSLSPSRLESELTQGLEYVNNSCCIM